MPLWTTKKHLTQQWRKALWLKIINHGIKGKCLNIIMDMYSDIKSMTELNGEVSDTFYATLE